MNGVKWTDADIQILQEYPTLNVSQLAIKLNRSKQAISNKMHQLGLFSKKYSISKNLKKELQGLTVDKIAERMNISRQKARTYIKYNNIQCSYVRWTPEEDKLLIDNYQKMFLKDLQKTFFPDRSYTTVKSRKEKLKLVKEDRGKLLIGYTVGDNHPNWEGGKSYEPYCYKFNEALKEQVRNAFGRRCMLCNIAESELMANMKAAGKRPCKLHVHHIGSDKMQGCDGIKITLVPLCISCHISLHWNPEMEEILIKKYHNHEQKSD